MSINYTGGFHANGFQPEGSVVHDRLYDNFTVARGVTIPAGSGVVVRGTAMGRITASGKWVKSLAASSDGSQVIRGIMIHDVDATSADVQGITGRRGSCNGAAVTFGTGHSLASTEDACMDRGIIFESVIG